MMNRVGGSHQSHSNGSVPSTVKQHQQQSRASSSLSWLSTSWSTSTSSTFPQRLMSIMLDHAYEDGRNVNAGDVICWLPHGKSFFIKDRDRFSYEILPSYFDGRAADYRSFTRRLLRWGFKRVPRGDEVGAFYHEFFLKDQPELCSKIKPCSRSVGSLTSSETSDERKTVVSPNTDVSTTVDVDSTVSVASSASSSGKKRAKASRRQGSISNSLKRQDFISDGPRKVVDVVAPHSNVAQAHQMTKEQRAWTMKMNQQQTAHDVSSRYKRISADSITSNGTGIGSSSSHFLDDDVAEPPEYDPNRSRVGRTDGKIASNNAFGRTGSQIRDEHAAHLMTGNFVSEGAKEKRQMLLDSLLVQQQLTLEHEKKKFQNEMLEQEIEYEINRRAMLASIQRRRQEEELIVEQERSRALKEHLLAQIVNERIEQEMQRQRLAASGSQEAVLQMLLALQEQRHMATMNHGVNSHPSYDHSNVVRSTARQQDDAYYHALLREHTKGSTSTASSMVATSIGNGGSVDGRTISDAAVNRDLAADLDVALSLVNLRRL